tara:strand:+ start:1531 stop:2457 length:927 start_codon:yes stop_codon:yes gene_type:complete
MQSKKIIFLLLFCLLFFGNKAFSKENKILLKLNNEIITTVDILNEIKFLSIMNKEFKNIEKNKKIEIAKNSLIKQKIKFIEISKFKKNIKLEDRIFEDIIKSYFKNLRIDSIKDFEQYFGEENLDTEFVKEKISTNTYWNQLIYRKFIKNVKINKVEIEIDIKNKKKQTEYLLSEIVFTIDSNENLKEKIELINKIINEKSFSEAALNYSISDTANNGGKLGWIKEEILNNKIKNEIKITKVGKFTKPLVIPGGFLILNIENIREIEKNIDEEKEIKNIIEKKTNDQLNRFSNIYINKLKKNIQFDEI